MSKSNPIAGVDRKTLFRTGLVLIGLLAGILLTLLFSGGRGLVNRPAVVERVELGTRTQTALVPVPGDVPPILFDAMSLNEAFKYVAARVTPSVVYIEVSTARDGVFRSFNGQSGSSMIPRSVGSGVIISDQGFVVTNNHVIEGADRIQVTLQDKREYTAEVIGTDEDTDLAVLKLESSTPLQAIPFGSSRNVAVGEWVIAVGNPFRLTSTVTAGIVSALGRNVRVIDNQFGIEDFIQTDAAINPGNSGGALVNLSGELIGISTAIATESGSYEGYGFAVPVDLMERVVADLIQYGHVNRGYLGVSIQSMDAETAKKAGLKEVRGVVLTNVVKGLAGDVAGLQDGDILLSIDGQNVSEPNELQSAIALHRPGEQFEVLVWRDGGEREYSVTLEGRDDPRYQSWFADLEASQNGGQGSLDSQPTPPGIEVRTLDTWGVGIASLDARFQGRFRVPHGAYIAFVEQDSPFGRAEVPRNVLLSSIDEATIFGVDDAVAALERAKENGEPVVVKVTRADGIALFFEVQVPKE